jgi:DNA-binding NtrC family response regulator
MFGEHMKSVLVISKEHAVFRTIHSCFRSGCRLGKAASKKQALEILAKKRYDLLFIDLQVLIESLPDPDHKFALQSFWHLYPTIEIVVMASQKMLRKAVELVKAGARDYLTYPLDPVEVKHVSENVNDSILMESELIYLRDRFWHIDSLELIQTKSKLMQTVFDKIRSVAPTKSTILLTGETGTGKSLMAKLIHRHSNRKDAQFISVHCGAIPDTLLESELFGHEKGAFTGAVRRKLGKFEIARGGTIFLDEIGTITPSAQIKLLEILQDGTFQRVGGEETLEANVRIITATNTDLEKMCAAGDFRKDLYYRLNVFPIAIPPLRERREDIHSISTVILNRLNKFYSKDIRSIHPHVSEAFDRYDWPGNIRELENLIERAYILEASSILTPPSFPAEFFARDAGTNNFPSDASITLAAARQQGLEIIESRYLRDVLTRNRGKINQSAHDAGITTRQLNKLMNKYGLRKQEFKS